MDYIPTTELDKKYMLKKIGIKSINEITRDFVPVYNNKLPLPESLSEQELLDHLTNISKMNLVMKYFIGAGSYHHYIPSAINHLVKRGEFLTGYTPYQAEMSQGILQSIYEYQSYICILTGMDIANASLYDGPSALAEAIILSSSYTGRKNIVVEDGLHPSYLDVISTYCRATDLRIIRPLNRLAGKSNDNNAIINNNNEKGLRQYISNETACVIVQNPDFYGNVRVLDDLARAAQGSGALFIVCVVEPTSLAIIKPPGHYGADIVVGEGQSFGIPMSFGGPSLGFMAAKSFLLRKLPGRICGMTTDSHGNRGFVLTLQAREQHIRRERATSNITTNVALMALSSTIYLALMGRSGLKNIAQISMSRAHLLQTMLVELGFISLNTDCFYNEFTLKIPSSLSSSSPSFPPSSSSCSASPTSSTIADATSDRDQKVVKRILSKLAKNGIAGGLDLGHGMLLICCTEMNTMRDIESYASIVKDEVKSVR
ncbi:MAG: aminomethyl-transferring glycine dehydrogenase subunit GcvPA [Nitrososphaeraceae archaeon]